MSYCSSPECRSDPGRPRGKAGLRAMSWGGGGRLCNTTAGKYTGLGIFKRRAYIRIISVLI